MTGDSCGGRTPDSFRVDRPSRPHAEGPHLRRALRRRRRSRRPAAGGAALDSAASALSMAARVSRITATACACRLRSAARSAARRTPLHSSPLLMNALLGAATATAAGRVDVRGAAAVTLGAPRPPRRPGTVTGEGVEAPPAVRSRELGERWVQIRYAKPGPPGYRRFGRRPAFLSQRQRELLAVDLGSNDGLAWERRPDDAPGADPGVKKLPPAHRRSCPLTGSASRRDPAAEDVAGGTDVAAIQYRKDKKPGNTPAPRVERSA